MAQVEWKKDTQEADSCIYMNRPLAYLFSASSTYHTLLLPLATLTLERPIYPYYYLPHHITTDC
jgi:hypothetical protein